MGKIVDSVKKRPVNPILMVLVLCLYFLNNLFFKGQTHGLLRTFLICHFNDLICPLFFISYSNLLLLTVGKELKKLPSILLFGFAAALIWEFFAPVIKPETTTDLLDVLFYMIGTFFYWCILKISAKGDGV